MSNILKRSLWLVLAVLLAGVLLVMWLTRDLALTNVSVMLNAITGRGIDTPAPELLEARLRLPEGFSLSLYAEDLPMVRMLAVTEAGDLLTSRPRAGEVVWLHDSDGDGRADLRRVVIAGLDRPHGLALRDGWLYIAETDAVGRVRFDSTQGRVAGDFERLVQGLPGGGNHWSRSIGFGPDGKLYLSVGSSCNACEEADPRRAAMLRFNPDGSEVELFATGLRNTVGFDFAPWNGILYGTDNGRDLLGDDFPPCELNQIEQGGFYGWPYIHGFGVPDPELGGHAGERSPLARSPVHGFGAHTAPLGIHFLGGIGWPGFERAALVALHGSWNRTTPAGYQVVSLHWQSTGEIEQRDFLRGFELDGKVTGRPVDIVADGVGGVYISDDYAGAVYRVRYGAASRSDGLGAPAVDGPVNAVSGTATARQQDTVDRTATGRDSTHRDVDGDQDVMSFEAMPPLQRARSITAGREQYRHWRCASCHDGSAGRPLSGLQSRYDIGSLAAFLETPTPPMPAFPMDTSQRRALAVYLLARYP